MPDDERQLLTRTPPDEVQSLDFRQIRDQVKDNYESMRNLRENRKEAIQQYLGWSHSEAGSDKQVPVNIVEQQVSILSNWLAPGIPRIHVRSPEPRLRPAAAKWEAGLNRWLDDTRFSDFLQLYIRNAIFCMGVAKVGTAKTGMAVIDGRQTVVSTPFVDNIDFDDFVYDIEAPRDIEIGFYGSRYRPSLEAAMNNPDYEPKARQQLIERELNADTDSSGGMRSEQVGSGGGMGSGRRSIIRRVELVDVYLPHQRLMLTFPWEGRTWRPLSWAKLKPSAPDPYRLLCFDVVPGKVVPLAPVMTAMPLHNAANAAYRKILRQLARQKSHLVYNEAEDAERILKEPDGAAFKATDGVAKEVRWGGPDQASVAIAMHLRQLAPYMLGNLDVLGGLQSRADTLGQEKMMAGTASLRIKAMQQAVYHAEREIVRSVFSYLWNDPLLDLRGARRGGSGRSEVTLGVTRETREGRSADYDIDVEPYSMQPTTPSERTSRIVDVVQLLGGLGIRPDPSALTRLLARYLDQPELEELYAGLLPSEMGMEGGKPAQTTRTYERTSRGGMSQGGGESQMIQAMLSGGSAAGGNGRGG